MEYIIKNKEKQKLKPMLSENNNGKYTYEITKISKKEKINFTQSSKNNCNILKNKKKMKNEFLAYKGQKHNSIKNKKMFNSNKYYIYNAIYNKIFIMLNFFMIFFFISPSKQNSDLSQFPSMQKIVVTRII
jgi:hypothetical protein